MSTLGDRHRVRRLLTMNLRSSETGAVPAADGQWQTFGQRTAYDNRWVRVELVEVQTSSGARSEHHVVHLGRIAIALIVNERDEVLMLYRHRFAVVQWGYELLGGLVEDDEDPAATAAREALEESGWQPVGQPEPLISFEPL